MAYAFAGYSFKSYNYRPYHWVGAQGGGPSTPTDTVGRTVSASIGSGSVVSHTPPATVNSRSEQGRINVSL